MAAPDARLLTGEGGSPSGAGRAGRLRSMRLTAIPLLGRLRHRGLENPLLPLPAVLAVAVGFFVPLAVLVFYSFWPTEDGRIIHRWTVENYPRSFSSAGYPRMLPRTFWSVVIALA